MTSTAADLLTLLGALIVVIGGTCAYWQVRDWLDKRALQRLREAQMADALQASVRQARDRYTTDDDRSGNVDR